MQKYEEKAVLPKLFERNLKIFIFCFHFADEKSFFDNIESLERYKRNILLSAGTELEREHPLGTRARRRALLGGESRTVQRFASMDAKKCKHGCKKLHAWLHSRSRRRNHADTMRTFLHSARPTQATTPHKSRKKQAAKEVFSDCLLKGKRMME